MATNKTKLRRGGAFGMMRRSQIAIAVTVALSVMAAWTMLGYSSGLRIPSARATGAQQASPASFNANSPSKEYVYAGARLIATEEPAGVCSVTLTPATKSFPATLNMIGGGPQPGSVAVTAATGCSWTATSNASFITVTSGIGTGNGSTNYNVATNSTGAVRTGTITVNDQTFTVYQGFSFADVAPGDPFYDEIGKLAARGVTLGCGNGNYCPNDQVNREQMSAFILRAKGEFNPPTPASQRFGDVPPSNQFYNFIDRLAVLGITLGCQPGTPPLYCPSAPVKREQMSAFILRGLGEFNPPTPASQHFGDVPPSNDFYNFIDRMWVLGITLGCQPGNPPLYCPNDSVTRGQMAAFLVRAFNL